VTSPGDPHVDPALVDAALAAIDARLSRQLDEILHHPAFQALERAWRGLWFLVERTNFAENIRILMLDWSKDDLRADLDRPGGVEASLLLGIVYTAEQGRAGGEPYAAILADFAFGPEPADLELLRRAGAVGHAALSPFIASAAPSFYAAGPRACAKHAELRAALESDRPAWTAFRKTAEARFVGLVLPRFLLRDLHGAAPSFAYEEHIEAPEARCWGHATYALATRLVESFARYRWCPNIIYPDAGGDVGPLPLHPYPLGEGRTERIPTEIPISNRHELELSEDGLIPLACGREGVGACFCYAPSARWPETFPETEEGRAAELNMRLGLTLPYLFIITRVMHYLRVMYRLHRGLWGDRAGVEKELNDWIGQFVSDRNPETARRLLRKAKIVVHDSADPEAWRRLEFIVRPHFKHMGAFFTLQLTGRLDP
jgi:type VI secretion system protein ImpC